MPRTIDIDPVSRIEGHLAFRIETEADRIVEAYSSGEMFRGFEAILTGRDPLDAQQITQRICGVCPVSHGTASVLAQDMAYGVTPPENGRLARNIILAANYIQSHILHFYQLSALDFIDIAAVTQYAGKDPSLLRLKSWVESQTASNVLYPGAPFLPRYDAGYVEDPELNITAIKHYLTSLEIRTLAHQLGAVFAGKLPHATAIMPGGVTETVTAKKIAACASMIEKLKDFITTAYLSDVAAVAQTFPEYFEIGKGCGNFLAYGVFPESEDPSEKFLSGGVVEQGALKDFDETGITEDVRYSLFSSPSGLEPGRGKTVPAPGKSGAYSWIKAPRYHGRVMEVGPLARMMVAYLSGTSPDINNTVDGLLSGLGKNPEHLDSVLGRHAARALECKIIADRCTQWIDRLTPGKPVFKDFNIPEKGIGTGLTEAPRGALGHWLEIENHKIKSYQCVVPTTWNCSPRDDEGNPGAVEQALVGTLLADTDNPMEATRVIRSFDPCIACAVH
jgi:Ni,Fe-hydrogenase I large subunit